MKRDPVTVPASDTPGRFTDDQLHMTARLYYMDGMAQGDVARLMRVSQPQVSRMLALARERGIVQITVADFDPRNRSLESALRKVFKLKKVVVIRTTPGLEPSELRQSIGHFAAPFASDLLRTPRIIAIAGGRTLAAVVRQIKQVHRTSPLTVLQAMGQIGAVQDECDAMELGRMLAGRLGGTCHMLNTPAFFPDTRTRDTVAALDQIETVTNMFRKADTALVGVGTPVNSVFVERNVLSEEDRASLDKAGAVGEICGRYFNARGVECSTPLRDRVISVRLEDLQRIPNVIAVVSGGDRAEALCASIRGGMVKSLVIDEAGAEALHAVATPTRARKGTAA